MSLEAPDDEGNCWTCGRDWNLCRHGDEHARLVPGCECDRCTEKRAAWRDVNAALDAHGDGPEYRAAFDHWASLSVPERGSSDNA